ncbi:TonB-dependent receptor [Dysgonomonas sp. Marseille-P4677]|uniref:TonB-dependent receptor n=1 Tax=Dysgonomonas sp. Marseille-P4677 TaxID=2364790 RepID=UPI001911E922|nr:TonB-dependent receptor [Dysgonomonas sp. Marseille-P4677]MBK5720570.1 TonB-dependent receptor [Dysgonomonas sp. Marseille-P4677]
MRKLAFLLLSTCFTMQVVAQQTNKISGRVTDKYNGNTVENAAISILGTDIGVLSDSIGYYELCHLPRKKYVLQVNNIGYKNDTISVFLDRDLVLDIRMEPSDILLDEVVVNAKSRAEVTIIKNTIDRPDADFNKLLNVLPGVTTMNIGVGISKPVVRGLGYNRVAVVDNGIIQQNQQWGADHGISINQFDVYKAKVYKGPTSLLLGSGTMSAIEIEPFGFDKGYNPSSAFSGEAATWGASNNGQLGGALAAAWHKGNWYVRGSYKYQEYGDYRVPADKFTYDGEDILLSDKRLQNTAGREQSLSGVVGYRNKHITTYLTVSNNHQKNGLFELGHDHDHEEADHDHDHDHDHEDIDHDHDHHHDHDIADTSHRNIGLPYSISNHFSITNNTEWKNSRVRLLVNTGYQNNHRREFEHFHEHYEGQPEPLIDDDLAVDFKLQTYSTNARLYLDERKSWKKIIGMSAEYQQNRVGGFEYFLPRYNQVTGGVSFVNIYEASRKLKFEGGIRYDIGHIDITGYYDDALAQHLLEEGYSSPIVQGYAQRAYDVNRNFGSISGSISGEYLPDMETGRLSLKLNIGKSFRFPSANELGANGLHHAAFRYEIGNPDLKAEHGYTFDFDVNYNKSKKLTLNVNPFVSYYTNFIYLSPVINSPIDLYESQPYKYLQAKALSGGGEYKVSWRTIEKLELSTSGSLVLNKNLDNHEPLPFTPPFTMVNEIKFLDDSRYYKKISYYQLSFSHQWYANQNRVAVGEEKTRGTSLFNFSAGMVLKLNRKWAIDMNMQVNNIFDTRYLNHMSLYRRLNIPEQGRNVKFFIRIPFNS